MKELKDKANNCFSLCKSTLNPFNMSYIIRWPSEAANLQFSVHTFAMDIEFHILIHERAKLGILCCAMTEVEFKNWLSKKLLKKTITFSKS